MDITKLQQFFGGITKGERDRRVGVAFNVEDCDIFENQDYIEPTTIFVADDITRRTQAYEVSEADNGYAYSQSADGDAEIMVLATASADNPTTWSSAFESTGDVHPNGTLAWFKWNTGADYLYYPTISGTTVSLKKLGDLTTYTETTAALNGTDATTLDGLDATGDRMQFIKGFTEMYILNGKYISKISSAGVFTQHAFTLDDNLTAVSAALKGEFLYILCKYANAGLNSSRIAVWDLSHTTQAVDYIDVPCGGPQWIANHGDILRVLCVRSGTAQFFEVQQGLHAVKTHELASMKTETAAQPISPVNTVFIDNNILYFGLWKTDKTGLYALGRVTEGAPLALVLAKRFDTSDYSTHTPNAASKFGNNWFAAMLDNATENTMRIEGNNSPTRSSNAVYESVWFDGGNPEAIKDWRGYIVLSKVIPTSCEIKVDCKVDNATNYDTNSLVTLTSTNDYNHGGGTAGTYWHRITTSLAGRFLRIRIRFTSSTTTKPTLYQVSILSDARKTI